MEVLLFALFFIVSLIFFIAGKDDFGRKEKKLIINAKGKKEEVNDELESEQKESVKKEVHKSAFKLYPLFFYFFIDGAFYFMFCLFSCCELFFCPI